MIYCFLADGFEESEALVTVDILRRAGVSLQTVAVGKAEGEPVTGSHGIPVTADLRIEELEELDGLEGIILPGGLPGTDNLDADSRLSELVAYAAENGRLLAAICAAPSLLGKRGYLSGKRVTAYPGYEHTLSGAEYTGLPAVRDGSIITGKGAGAVFEFAFEIVRFLCGDRAADELKDGMQCVR